MVPKEIRSKLKKEFDWQFYVYYHNDLNHVKTRQDAWDHFKKYGYFENRMYNDKNLNMDEKFDWEFYVNHHPDLKHLTNKYKAWEHYVNHGINEKRSINKEGQKTIVVQPNIQETANYILIVMPTYNRSDSILKSIEYVKNQTYKYWRFLIIDDGSDQHHKTKFNQIKEKYKNDDNIVFMENDVNCQVAKTLNRGIQYLLDNDKFTHFTWISDDNEYYPNFLNDLVLNNTYFKYTAYDIQELNGTKCTNRKSYVNFNDILNNFNGCASFMWKKEAIKKIGFYNETVPGCEDFEYLLRTFKQNESCIFSDKPTMKYLRHPSSLMEQKREEIMNIKREIIVDFKLKYIDTISYIKYYESQYLLYYINKTNKIIDIINSIKKLETEHVVQDKIIFDTNNDSIVLDSDLLRLNNYLLEAKYNKIYILNELDYCHLKACYQSNEYTKQLLINFFKKSTYLITFTEIFMNTNFQTVGNTSFNKEYSILFFNYAYKVLVCDSQNLFYLYDNINPLNVIYNPPINFLDDTHINKSDNQDIDILFYGSLHDKIFEYRKNLLEIVQNFASKKGYVFKIYNRDLYADEKDKILERTKIVIHVASLPNLRTIPWAKITELCKKEVFFLIEYNLTEFNIHEMNISSYNVTNNNGNISTNICEIIEFYLSNPEKRNKSILRNKNYFSKYNNTSMLGYIFNYNNFNQINLNNEKKRDINKIIAFNYGTENFHSNLIIQYKNFIEKNNDIIFSYYHENFTYIFGYSSFWSLDGMNPEIFEKYIGCNEDYKENMYSFENNKKIINNFLINYKEDRNTLYVFGAEDIMAFFYYFDASNYDLFYDFLNKTNYIIFQCEVIPDNNLFTIGFTNKEFVNKYCVDFNLFERKKFLKYIYLKSQKTYICDTKNKYYLESVGIKNLTYFPPYIELPFNILNIEKTIDCLFYGTIVSHIPDSYRNKMIESIKNELSSEINFVACGNLYDNELIEKINCSKIVLHIPSHDNLRTMPWAKISYLMTNKIFFIIEENDELFLRNLQDTIIYYKRGNINDLKNKIIYYKDNEQEKKNVAEKCYKYFIENFDNKILLKDL